MSFDQAVIFWCVLVPASIAAGASWLASTRAGWVAAVGSVIGWWLAVAIALAGCQGLQWWPEESWQRIIWPALGWVLFLSTTARFQGREWRWVLAGILAAWTAMVSMPQGEAWSDLFDLYRDWIPLLVVSCLANGFAIESMAKTGAGRWCLLVTVGALLGPLVLAATTYGSLAQWALALVVATFSQAVVGLFRSKLPVWIAAFPAWAAAVGVVASARFYTYEEHPVWLYGLILFSPTLIASIDLAIHRRSERGRVIVSATASLLIIGAVTWTLLSS